MFITIKWFDGNYPSFNVGLTSKEGADEFLSIKGCRIVNGNKGEFVSWPATKNASTGKFWNHVWGNDKFSAAVLEKAKESMPSLQAIERSHQSHVSEDDIPF